MDSSYVISTLCNELDKKFGKDIVALDLRELSPVADFFVLATGNSAPQLNSLAETAKKILTEKGLKLSHVEGVKSAQWVLLDFGDVIVHIFDNEARQYYNLERVWRDAKTVDFSQFKEVQD